MRVIQRFKDFESLTEATLPKRNEDYDYVLHYLLYSVLIKDICTWIESADPKGYYIESPSKENSQNLILFSRSYTDWISDCLSDSTLTESLAKRMKRQVWFKFKKIIEPKTSKVGFYNMPRFELEVSNRRLRDTIIYFGDWREQSRLTQINHKVTSIDSSWKRPVIFPIGREKKAWSISLDELLKNYNKGAFKKRFVEQWAKKITHYFLEQCVLRFLDMQFHDDKISSSGKLSLREYLSFTEKEEYISILESIEFFLSNNHFFEDILKEMKRCRKILAKYFSMNNSGIYVATLPNFVCFWILLNGSDIQIDIEHFGANFIDAVQKDLEMLSLCKKNIPNLYSWIKSKRDLSDQWKTDLSADLGNLGF